MLSKFFTLVAIICFLIAGVLLWQMYTPQKLEFAAVPETSVTNSSVTPQVLNIPSLELSLAMYPSEIKNNRWPTTTKGISYLVTSPVPGEAGNSIIYGHNWPSILGNLPEIKIGDEINVQMTNGEIRKFKVENTVVVSPSQTDILNQTALPRITIYTCVGFLDSKRFVVVATPV